MFENKKGSIFAGIGKAPELDAPKTYFDQPGEYLVELIEAVHGTSKNPKRLNQAYAAHKFKILESNQRGESAPLEVGTEASLVKFLTNEWALRDVKALIAAVIGCPQGQVTIPIAEEFYENGEAVAGTQLRIEVKAREAKDGRVFHNCYFSSTD